MKSEKPKKLMKPKKVDILSARVRKAAIAALEKMKAQEDVDARNAASCDEPNAGWHYQNAKDSKETIDRFIKLLKAVPYESKDTLIIAEIIKIALRTGIKNKTLEK